jgi:G:T/U-mismatch repair DNA glycosylase
LPGRRLTYEDRLSAAFRRSSALLAHGVGLWDVIAEAERPGSLDAAIRDPAANDLLALIETCQPALRRLQRRNRRQAGRAASR